MLQVPGAVVEVPENQLQIPTLKKAMVSKIIQLHEVPNVTNVPGYFKGCSGRLHVWHEKKWQEVQFDGAFATYATKKVCTDISYHFLFVS